MPAPTIRVPRSLWATAFCLLAPHANAAHGQDGALRGVVKDSAGVVIADADVAIIALHQLTRSDAQGRFVLTKVPAGEHELSVRRIGYTASKVKVTVTNAVNYSYDVVLSVQAAVIDGVNVTASEKRQRLGIEDFYRRQARGMGGRFFTREDILTRNARQTSDVLRGSPGVRFVRIAGGQGVRFPSSNMRRGDCMPMIWLDGQHANGMEVDHIPVTDIEAMEVYTGPATVPMQFSQQTSTAISCGAIVIWTRIPGTP
jgi:hypothetical protein